MNPLAADDPRERAQLLDASTPLGRAPRRVLVCGVTGVGKSTLAARLGRQWELPYVELDALHHGPQWSVRPSFMSDARALAAGDCWITEWQYLHKGLGPLLGQRADTLIWLDFPRRIARARLLRRTVIRRLRRQPLWNGNTEPPLHWFFTHPEESILRYEMKTHDLWRRGMPGVLQRYPHLHVIRLASPREVRRWLAGPAAQPPAPVHGG